MKKFVEQCHFGFHQLVVTGGNLQGEGNKLHGKVGKIFVKQQRHLRVVLICLLEKKYIPIPQTFPNQKLTENGKVAELRKTMTLLNIF